MPLEQEKTRGVYINTYGCQMNVNDTERMYALLEMINYAPAPTPEKASLIIINSCSVREKPVHKVHSEVGRYKKLKQQNPHLRIGVAGCVAQQEKQKLIKDIPLLDFVIGTDAIDQLPEVVSEIESKKKKVVRTRFEHQKPYEIQTLIRNPKVSAFVNITKGCDNFCTFCVVPFTRGRERSRPLKELVEDLQRLTQRGVKEVTLLGQNVNSYTSSCGADFADLLKSLALQTDIERIRYTTSHPKDFNEKLVEVMATYQQKICEYVHLPVQSGNSQVLERMNRGYTRKEYIKKAHMILKNLKNACLSTDIIVGFPGETRQQFEDTLSLLDEVPYESLFAFKYSPRPFTKASKFEDQIDEKEKSKRLHKLFEKHETIAFRLAEKYNSQVLKVLIEEVVSKVAKGRSTQNKVVHFKVPEGQWVGKTVPVHIDKAFPQTLRGSLCS